MIKKTVIIDTDPGIDDAMAIALALFSQEIDVPLITTVAGNVGLENVTTNTLRLLSFFKKHVKVAKGASQPLLRVSEDASQFHGETGLAGFSYDKQATECLIDTHAVNAMYQELMKRQKTTVLAIGPLTNIALLLRMYPDSVHYIDEIVIMGGAINRGNYGVYTEFNSGFDPEATKIVYSAPVKKVMIGLEIGNQAIMEKEVLERLGNINGVGKMLSALFKHYQGEYFDKGVEVYDSTAIGYILHPEWYTCLEASVDVELCGTYTSGATLVDFTQKSQYIKVCTTIDAPKFIEWIIDSVAYMSHV
ncbi:MULTISPECIES: nucleoside hydrolase [unclassified Granulicatella]|uniref:nucleoside hydrolase n=1 Tax=unclassified Granulicatella TaxID=2630493 RepID=UPI0010735628|nr:MULTISPECIES: nucleoside hydrolase [unclassified Granulicatella]MBF0779834.1 nucleoside hydrolase [Granulicatella sp. 19428wC4_WM01]TFU96134.1 ribonucleoside hydrolase RihC [Granulicatella sp. WM01]